MKLTGQARKMFVVICVTAAAFITAGLVAGRVFEQFNPPLPYIFGVLLTSAINVLKVKMLDDAAAKAVDMESRGAANYIRLQYLLRFFLTGAALVVAALTPVLNLLGAALGVLTWPVAAYSLKFIMGKE